MSDHLDTAVHDELSVLDAHAPIILIADDDGFSRHMLRTGLESQGYRVEEAVDGIQALESFTLHHPNLILIDGRMPNIDGFDVCQRLQLLPGGKQTPIIMITGLDDPESVDKAFEAGAVDFITKPVHWAVLLNRIHRLIVAKQAEETLLKAHEDLELRVRQRTTELTDSNARLQEEAHRREQVTKQLYHSEQRLRRITDNMLDCVCQVDENGLIEYASPSCRDIFGYMPEALAGQSIYRWIHPDDLQQVKDSIENVGRAEYRYQCADGAYIWVETLSSWLFENSDEPIGMVWASRDITERKRAEQEMRHLNRLKTDFLSTAAHELRTPLVSIRGFTEILMTRELDNTRQQRYLGMINEQSTQLGQILDDLLDISRLEAKQHMTLSLEPVNMVDLLNKVTSFFEGVASHSIKFEPPSECPPILADPTRVAQVLKNLMSNAIKYSPHGTSVTLEIKSLPNALQIGIHDAGIGLTPEQMPHLFEKFYRADASNTAVGGTGLGLSICKLIVELHGGKLWAESTYGVGSTFFFTLPLADTR